jgi:hypothetical protein
MARLLSFANYLGQANNVQVIEMFPSTQKTMAYNFGGDVTNYTFEADYQPIVLDQLSYNSNDGEPNFTNTNVTGFFANAEVNPSNIVTTDANQGIIKLTIPAQRYTGPITPDARANVTMTVLSFKWTNTGVTPTTTESHRWGIIERYEPDVSPGNPTLSNAYIQLGIGAINTFSDDSSASGLRTAGTYINVSGTVNGTSQGVDAQFQIVVASDGTLNIDANARGIDYTPGDVITILDSALGGGGAPDVNITVLTTA